MYKGLQSRLFAFKTKLAGCMSSSKRHTPQVSSTRKNEPDNTKKLLNILWPPVKLGWSVSSLMERTSARNSCTIPRTTGRLPSTHLVSFVSWKPNTHKGDIMPPHIVEQGIRYKLDSYMKLLETGQTLAGEVCCRKIICVAVEFSPLPHLWKE